MKHLRKDNFERFLALDLHPRSLGYAVFENADLLDWGLRKWGSGDNITARRKLCRLIDLWKPTRILIREGAPHQEYAIVQALASGSTVPIRTVKRRMVHSAFSSSRRLSRFDIAKLVAESYPELALRVPTARKLGHAEPFQIRMFNAAAIGIAHFKAKMSGREG